MLRHAAPIALIACGHPPTTVGTPQPDTADTADTAPIPITILGHCPGFEPGTKPPAVTITGHPECVEVMLTNTHDAWIARLEVCDGYGEYEALQPGEQITAGVTGHSCEEFADWGSGGVRIAVSMVVDGVCFGSGDGSEWCP